VDESGIRSSASGERVKMAVFSKLSIAKKERRRQNQRNE